MLSIHATPTTSAPRGLRERRLESRQEVICPLWMIDHAGSAMIRCHCIELSQNGMRVKAPLGYGIATGQRYELKATVPGMIEPGAFSSAQSRWATVIRAVICAGAQEDYLELGLVLDESAANV